MVRRCTCSFDRVPEARPDRDVPGLGGRRIRSRRHRELRLLRGRRARVGPRGPARADRRRDAHARRHAAQGDVARAGPHEAFAPAASRRGDAASLGRGRPDPGDRRDPGVLAKAGAQRLSGDDALGDGRAFAEGPGAGSRRPCDLRTDEGPLRRRPRVPGDVAGSAEGAWVARIAAGGARLGAIEVNLSTSRALERVDALAALRARVGCPVLLAHLRTSEDAHFDGRHFSHFINTGIRADELDRWSDAIGRRRAAAPSTASPHAPSGAAIWWRPPRSSNAPRNRWGARCCARSSSPRTAWHGNHDDDAIAALAARATVLSLAARRVRFVFDTFMDVDRGYFPRNGFIDRRYNPLRASSRRCARTDGDPAVAVEIGQSGEGVETLAFRRCYELPAAVRRVARCVDDRRTRPGRIRSASTC